MRLTLRTMLAYLDDVLEPADAQDLGQKIEESEFATGLVHRVRSSMRRLRLGAPKLEGKAVGLDCNTVAEYLDNTLPPDQVPDFEKVCLESDVHLAEVSACHQVLTLVLGEPAEVEPATRERVYRIGAPNTGGRVSEVGVDQAAGDPVPPPKSDMSAAAVADTASTTADAPQANGKSRKKLEVPDYLRSDSQLRTWPIVITLFLALLLAGAVIMALGPETVMGWFGMGDPTVATAPADSAPTPDAPAVVPGATDADTPEDAAAETPADASDIKQPAGVVPGDPADRTEQPGDAAATVGTATTPGADVAAAGEPAEPPDPADHRDPLVEDPVEGPLPPKAAEDEVARLDPFDDRSDDELPEEEPVPPVAGDAADLGRFTSDREILIRQDAESGEWIRLPARVAVHTGDRLLALPTFRPQIMLIGGVQVMLDGATAVRLAGPDAAGVPWINIEYGRVVLITVGKAGAQVGLQMGERRGLVTFGDADSTAAVQVSPFQQPGTDPESMEPHTLGRVLATSGTILWQPSDSEAVRLEAGRMRTFLDTVWAETVDVGELPKWISEREIDDIDRQASEQLQPELAQDGREISLRLLELADHRRPEVRSLATRCGAYVDQFEPFIPALNDPLQKSYWVGHVDVLFGAVQRGPETAAQLRQAFEKHRNADAKNLYRLLWSFSVDDLKKGYDAKLVDYLDHDSMDYRVLASENLRRITGGKTLLYRAEHTAERRRSSVQRWRELLNTEGVQYASPPLPLPEPVDEAGTGPEDIVSEPAP